MRKILLASLPALLVAGVLVPVGATASCATADHAGGDWPTYGKDLVNTRSQSAETTIGADNVEDLTPRWVFSSAAVGGVGSISTWPWRRTS